MLWLLLLFITAVKSNPTCSFSICPDPRDNTCRCLDQAHHPGHTGCTTNGVCEDGGNAKVAQLCNYGADCTDCGPRGICRPSGYIKPNPLCSDYNEHGMKYNCTAPLVSITVFSPYARCLNTTCSEDDCCYNPTAPSVLSPSSSNVPLIPATPTPSPAQKVVQVKPSPSLPGNFPAPQPSNGETPSPQSTSETPAPQPSNGNTPSPISNGDAPTQPSNGNAPSPQSTSDTPAPQPSNGNTPSPQTSENSPAPQTSNGDTPSPQSTSETPAPQTSNGDTPSPQSTSNTPAPEPSIEKTSPPPPPLPLPNASSVSKEKDPEKRSNKDVFSSVFLVVGILALIGCAGFFIQKYRPKKSFFGHDELQEENSNDKETEMSPMFKKNRSHQLNIEDEIDFL